MRGQGGWPLPPDSPDMRSVNVGGVGHHQRFPRMSSAQCIVDFLEVLCFQGCGQCAV